MEQRRQMGLAATLSVVTGESIALGIFLTPAAMARSLGSPLLLAAVWCGMGLITLCGALCYSELAINYPLTGGEYVYLRQGYGTRLSRRVMTTANLLKIAVLVCLVLWAWLSGHATTSNLLPLTVRRPGSEPLFAAIAGATVSAFFSFGGWWEAGKIAGEVRNPRRNMPLAFTCGVLLVTAVYLLVSASFLMVVPLEKIVSNTAFVAQFGEALFGTIGGKVLSACVLLSVLGGLMALTMAAPRVYYAMAKDGAFFAPFGKLHPRFGTPANAVLLQTILALLVLTFGAFDRILSFIIFSAVCFLALSVTTLFRMPQPVRRWWFPIAPIVFLLGCAIIDLMILMHDPIPALIGLVIVLCGDPVRRFFFAKSTLATNPLPQQIAS